MITYEGKTHIFNHSSDLSEVRIKSINDDTEIRIDGAELIKFIFTQAPEKFKTLPTSISVDYESLMDVITDTLVYYNKKLLEGSLLIKGVFRDESFDDQIRSAAEDMAYPIYENLKKYFADRWIIGENDEEENS